MRETMLPERDSGWCFFLSVVREEAARSRPAAKKKAPPPKGQRQRVETERGAGKTLCCAYSLQGCFGHV